MNNSSMIQQNALDAFLEYYGVLASDDEDSAYVELMMDNHKYVELGGQGYYLPEDASYSPGDRAMYEWCILNSEAP